MAIVAATVAVIAPLFFVRSLPFTDLPEHVAAMASIAHYGDPAWRIEEHYVIAWTKSQYLLFHLSGAGLTLLLGDAVLAMKVLLAVVAALWVATSRALLRALAIDERVSLLAALLFWNRALVVGFLPYVASIPVLQGTLALFLTTLERPSRRRYALLAVLGVVTFYSHVSALTLLCGIAPLVAYLRLRRIRAAAESLLWLLPAVALAAQWGLSQRFSSGLSTVATADPVGRMAAGRAMRVAGLWVHDIWTSHVDDWIGVAFWCAFAVLLVDGLRVPSSTKTRIGLVPVLVAVALYLLTPFRVGAVVLLNVRLAPVVALFALTGLRSKRVSAVAPPIFALLFVGVLAQSVDNVVQMRRLERDVAGVHELLRALPRGSRLVTLNFDGFDPREAHFAPWIHVGSYARAYGASVTRFSFSDMDHWSLQYRPERAPPKEDGISWGLTPCFFRNSREGDYFDYVLVRGKAKPFASSPPGPVWRVRGTAPEYTLYEKVEGARSPGEVDSDVGPCSDKPSGPPDHTPPK